MAESTDLDQAMTWFQKSADAGNAKAMYYIGVLYHDGKGVPKDAVKALDWFTKAAKLGDADARAAIAQMSGGGRT